MDFPADRTARELPDEYMFGPALLVAPSPSTSSARAPLPARLNPVVRLLDGPRDSQRQHRRQRAARPHSHLRPRRIHHPYARPCSTSAKALRPHHPLRLRRANASFTLYEDQGTTFDYEKGAFSEIPIRWDDKTATITLGKRTGSFDGMLDHRTFNIVLVSAAHPSAYLLTPTASSPTPATVKSAQYTGAELHLHLR